MRIKYIILITAFLFASCETQDCNLCEHSKTSTAPVTVKVTIDEEQQDGVPVEFYEDELKEDNRVATVLAENETEEYNIKTEQEYVVKAEYYRGLDTIAAVDVVEIEFSSPDRCNSPCYIPSGEEVNVQLKQ